MAHILHRVSASYCSLLQSSLASKVNNKQNGEMSYFKAYKFTDSDVLDNDIKTAIGWYINNAIDKKGILL